MKLRKLIIFVICAVLAVTSVGLPAFAEEELPDLTGKPWNDTSVVGNLPAEKPLPVDDFYAGVNYEWLRDAAEKASGGETMVMTDTEGSMKEAMTALILDDTYQSGTMDLIRIMYGQALDRETLDNQGIEPVQPYLDMIDSAETLEDFNRLLTDKSFPFTPFILTFPANNGMDGTQTLQVNPDFVFVDDLDGAVEYRGDISSEENWSDSLASSVIVAALSYSWVAGVIADVSDLVAWEASYGKDCPYSAEVNLYEYGTSADHFTNRTLEELQEMFGSYPITGVLAKDGQDISASYKLWDESWISSFAAVYTEENLEKLKEIAKVYVLEEAAPFISVKSPLYKLLLVASLFTGESADLAEAEEDLAYEAVSAVNTLSNALSGIYTRDVLGQAAVDRLVRLCEDIRDGYKAVIRENTWLEDATKEAIVQKLDLMGFNVLEPSTGYYDYEGVRLIPTEEGGTLFGNYLILKEYCLSRVNETINGPANSTSVWTIYAPTVQNAFYDSDANAFSLYPGLLNAYCYRADMSDEELYGSIGFIIGHEMSHAFDYIGSQFNALGKPEVWFTGNDLAEYCGIQDRLAAYYDGITIYGDVKANGQLLRGEACADLAALQALSYLGAHTEGFDLTKMYEASARLWATARDLSVEELYITLDEHPLPYLRINVCMQMLDQFYETYGVKEGDGMYLPAEERIQIW